MSVFDQVLAKQPGVAGTISDLITVLRSIDRRMAGLADLLAPKPGPTVTLPSWESLPYTPDAQIEIVGIVASGDTAGLYGLQIGSVIKFNFRLQANATAIFDLNGDKSLTAGLPVKLSSPSGSNAEATIIFRAWHP